MNVLYFLKERTKQIRYFYKTASEPFRETMRKIEAEEAPFDDPPYSEDGEPPYLEEWLQADTALEMLGRTCISMLSESLKLYFQTWERQLGIEWTTPATRKKYFENGFVDGYRRCFGEVLDLSWSDCPVDFAIIEQVVLARNTDQHPERITSLTVEHGRDARDKYPQPFFVRETERKLLSDPEAADMWWLMPTLHVSGDGLIAAIKQVELLAEWLQDQIERFWQQRRTER